MGLRKQHNGSIVSLLARQKLGFPGKCALTDYLNVAILALKLRLAWPDLDPASYYSLWRAIKGAPEVELACCKHRQAVQVSPFPFQQARVLHHHALAATKSDLVRGWVDPQLAGQPFIFSQNYSHLQNGES